MAGSVASMAEQSLQSQGIGMRPPEPSATTASESEGGSNNVVNKQKQNGGPVLYIFGEENANQIALRALSLGIHGPELLLLCETGADGIADRVANFMYGGHPPSFDRVMKIPQCQDRHHW